MKKLAISSKKMFSVLFIFLIIINILLLFWIFNLYKVNAANKLLIDRTNNFELLSPDIAWMNIDTFLERQHMYDIRYLPLKEKLIQKLNETPEAKFGLYFEDLITGASIGINEKEKFVPKSLFKVPVMVAVLKKVQEGDIFLNTTVYLSNKDINSEYGSLYKKGVGYNITVKDLLKIMIQQSDNTASSALSNNFLQNEDYLKVIAVMGLPSPDDTSLFVLSAKDYSNMFRSLYYSNYLRRPFSQLAIEILTETEYKNQLVAGVPNNITVAHKYGMDFPSELYHDCGIIYLPEKPYFLCVMSKGNTFEESNKIISEVSKMVYEYVKTN